MTLGSQLLKYQKRFACLAAGKRVGSHADPLLAENGMLKIEDLYKQQLRVHAWQFWNGHLPTNQANMFSRAAEVHRHATRSAGAGLYMSTRDHRSISYRVPTEWASLPERIRGLGSLAAFKRNSKNMLLSKYREFECTTSNCRACGRGGD